MTGLFTFEEFNYNFWNQYYKYNEELAAEVEEKTRWDSVKNGTEKNDGLSIKDEKMPLVEI